MRQITRALLAFPILLTAAACSSGSVNDEAGRHEAAHTEGDYAELPSHPFLWTKSRAYGEFLDAPFSTVDDRTKVIPDGDALEVRLQAWADRIDSLVRKKIDQGPTRLLAPKPILKVIGERASLNAWVSGTPVCLGMPFKGSTFTPAPSHALLGGASIGGIGIPDGKTCGAAADWPSSGDLLALWSQTAPKCDLQNTDGTLSSTKCRGVTAPDTMLFGVVPYVHFTTPLLASVDERTAVVVLAHELGHYYRAHPSTLLRHKYGFWYEHDPRLPGRPVQAEKAKQLEERYANVFNAPKGIVVEGSRYHARIHNVVADVAEAIRNRSEPDFPCANAIPKIGTWTWAFNFGRDLTAAEKAGFLAFEAEIATCAPALVPAPANQDLFHYLTHAISSGGFAPNDPPLQGFTSLGDLLARLGTVALQMDEDEREMLAKLREGKIGVYTREQEADDLALDISTKLGISSGEVLGAWLKFMQASEGFRGTPKEAETGEYGYAKCKALLDAGFNDGATAATMTLGGGDHHGNCYRLYNLWRENNAHHYDTLGTFTPPEGAPWSELAAHAAVLSGWWSAPAPPSATEPPQDVPSVVPESELPSSERSPGPDDAVTTGCSAAPSRGPVGSAGVPLVVAALVVALARVRDSRRRRT